MGYKVTYGDIALLFSFLSGAHYNLENIYYGFKEAKNKLYAFLVFLPYL